MNLRKLAQIIDSHVIEKIFFVPSAIWIRKSYLAKISAAPAFSKQGKDHLDANGTSSSRTGVGVMLQHHLFRFFFRDKTGVGLTGILALGRHHLPSSILGLSLEGHWWVSLYFADTFGLGGCCQVKGSPAQMQEAQLFMEEVRGLWALGRDAEVGGGGSGAARDDG